MRKFGYIFSTVVSLGLGGCGYFYPGFEGIFGLHSYIHEIPVDRITTELQCELRDFVREKENNDVLDSTFAGITIKFQTDQSGTFQYLGINLSKVGLAAVENLVSVSNKVPSLQAKVQAKTTASSQLELSIPQTLGELKGVPGLNSVKGCDDPNRKLLTSLSLTSFLDRFLRKLRAENQTNMASVCMSKITMSTQVVVVFDVSAGVNPLIGTAFILPVSGETFDFNPSATQSLNISLVLKKHGQCSKVPPVPQPATTLNAS